MIEFIVLSVLFIATVAFMGFLLVNERKNSAEQVRALMEQLKTDREMMLAGSYTEYQSVKQGKPLITNEVVDEPNSPEVSEDNPVPLSEITSIKIDDKPAKKITIIKQK